MNPLRPDKAVLAAVAGTVDKAVGAVGGTVGQAQQTTAAVVHLIDGAATLIARLNGVAAQAETALGRLDGLLTGLENTVGRADALVAGIEPEIDRVRKLVTSVGPQVARVKKLVDAVEPEVEKVSSLVGDAAGVSGRVDTVATRVERVVDEVEPLAYLLVEILARLSTPVGRLADGLGREEVDALIVAVNELPHLLAQIDTEVIPVMRSLTGTGEDVRQLHATVLDIGGLVDKVRRIRMLRLGKEDSPGQR